LSEVCNRSQVLVQFRRRIRARNHGIGDIPVDYQKDENGNSEKEEAGTNSLVEIIFHHVFGTLFPTALVYLNVES